MRELTGKPNAASESDAVIRRRRTPLIAFRRQRADQNHDRTATAPLPSSGRIVFRAGTLTLR